MNPATTAEVATPLNSAKSGAARLTDRAKGEAHLNFRAAHSHAEQAVRREGRATPDAASRADGLVENSGPKVSSDARVDDVADVAELAEPAGNNLETSASRLPALSPELAALFQDLRAPVNGSAADTESLRMGVGAPEADIVPGGSLPEVDIAGEDMSLLAEQLAARAASFGRSEVAGGQPSAQQAVDVRDNPKSQAAVSVSNLQVKTGFDAPVKVTASHQKWFQAIAPVLTGVAMPSMLRGDAKMHAAVGLAESQDADAVLGGAVSSLPESSIEAFTAARAQDSTPDRSDHQNSRDGTKRGMIAESALGAAKETSGARASSFGALNADVAPAYQQVRAAVVEVIVGAGGTQRTDYVSLYADRPTSSNLTLKTLEISLEPPDLGRVNVKMNLASRDLKLEIEASKASTAQLISNDQASLKRELLSDNADLSSVLVSVTSTVSDAGSSRGAANSDQQFSGNSRTTNENAFQSTTGGGREDRRSSQTSGPKESGMASRQRDADAETGGVRPSSAQALYI